MLDDDSSATGQVFTVFSNGEANGRRGEANGRRVPSVVNLTDGQTEALANQANSLDKARRSVRPKTAPRPIIMHPKSK
jgi:hypothetical protein